jgi:hypothetical protein
MLKEMLKKVGGVTDAQRGALATSPPLLYGPKETLAYLAHRALPLYGVVHRVMSDTAAALPDYSPKSMLDFGSGGASCAPVYVCPRTTLSSRVVESSRVASAVVGVALTVVAATCRACVAVQAPARACSQRRRCGPPSTTWCSLTTPCP